jgi:hypothetical protein
MSLIAPGVEAGWGKISPSMILAAEGCQQRAKASAWLTGFPSTSNFTLPIIRHDKSGLILK